jgi:hypothetical protein
MPTYATGSCGSIRMRHATTGTLSCRVCATPTLRIAQDFAVQLRRITIPYRLTVAKGPRGNRVPRVGLERRADTVRRYRKSSDRPVDALAMSG